MFIFDLVPYFLANTTVNPGSGRSMADNVRLWEEATGQKTGIVTRPEGEDFLTYVREIPGNLDRLADYLGRCQPRLLFTLGTEPAAFMRGIPFQEAATRVDDLFYSPPLYVEVLGVAVGVFHLVHPHLFSKKNPKWTRRHMEWCRDRGQHLVEEALGSGR